MNNEQRYLQRIVELDAELAEMEAEVAAIKSINDDLEIEVLALKAHLQRMQADRECVD